MAESLQDLLCPSRLLHQETEEEDQDQGADEEDGLFIKGRGEEIEADSARRQLKKESEKKSGGEQIDPQGNLFERQEQEEDENDSDLD